MKSKIITIAGSLGGGKTSTAKRVSIKLDYHHFSSGDLFRAVAAERGVTVEEINRQAELEQQIDHDVDERLRQMAQQDNLVIDSRLAFHWMPNSFRVYLSLDPHIAAERIYKHIRENGRVSEEAESVEKVLESIQNRHASERKRYADLYGVDVHDLTPFDIVIDTAEKDLEAVSLEIIEAYNTWLEGN
ncbi:MAG: cytidylate kinase family protein [Candidatus Pacebacteria bacterium]|nr:cytidylate kinase family protein [Candidatus Paceibacterota bacterium]